MAQVADLSRGPVLLSLSIGTALFSFSTTLVRFVVRRKMGDRVRADDWAILMATGVASIGTIFSIVEGSMTNPSRALEFDLLGQPWIGMAATLSKISICLFFIWLLGNSRSWRMALSALIVLMAIVNLTFSMTTYLQCQPLEKFWDPSVQGACWDPSVQLNFGYFQGAFSVFSWFFLGLFTIMVLRHPDIRSQSGMRWPFYVLSGLSAIAGIFSIIRTYETSAVGGQGLGVYTLDTFAASLLSILEQNLGIIAANAPTVAALFRRRSSKLHHAQSLRANMYSRAGSTRPFTSASSRASMHSAISDFSRKSRSSLIIEGPRRGSFESGLVSYFKDDTRIYSGHGDESYELEHGGAILDPEAWPRGIIKTVSVEVTEEVNPDHVPGSVSVSNLPLARPAAAHAAYPNGRASDVSVEQDWETMLRAGPARS